MKKIVDVNFVVEVEIDETKFTNEFMENFNRYFYGMDDIDEHICNLAYAEVKGFLDSNFLEGYGDLDEMGIKCKIIDHDEDISYL